MEETTIRQWYDIFKDNNELVEIRIMNPSDKRVYSGYFTDIETLLNEVKKFDHCNIYFTLNVIDDACYSREQHNKIVLKPKSTTSDTEIIARKWCLIDIDIDKPSDTNSTDGEKELAKEVVNNIYKFLRDEGFEQPVVCDSANGYHLLLKQAMLSNLENTDIMKKFLQVLDMYFSTDKIKIDCSTFNPSRICKLYGTYSRKGANTTERPQRCSSILKVPSDVKATPNEYFYKVASYLPQPIIKDRSNNYGASTFDLDEFFNIHNIAISNKIETNNYTKYVLAQCPFNSSHSAPDSAVFRMKDGSYGFKCLHNSCSQFTFKDFRLHYEPDAYSKKEYGEYQFKQRYYNGNAKPAFVPQNEDDTKGKKWLKMSDIRYIDISKLIALPTGYVEFDKKVMGLLLGEVTVLSGLSGAGKSSWLDCVMLNIVQRGYKCACWSGELQDFRFQSWINQIAAGKNYVKKKEGYDNFYYAPKNVCDKINSWLDDKIFLYNNEYGNKFAQIFDDVKKCVEENGVQLVILDNLMALNLDTYDGDKYSQQTKFIYDLKDYAKKSNIHILLVCHPRKENANTLLRKESISGTADLTNMCDNLIILHRVGNDFQKRATEFWGAEKVAEYMKYSTVIELCKNRSFGIVDQVFGMYYEMESRRLKNTMDEHIVYSWQEQGVQQKLDMQQDDSYYHYNDREVDFDDIMNEEVGEIPF
ncbi:AAA family ATPase [uncultured Bacteroides sp.]|uniref:AAA family ATPase n=1 Tax=uncultured Bacteroides sp. TaxID=162156 RepID=UPI0026374B33|nr:AAA family ATPase [uncultured Bacteroides sp.]